MTSRKSRTSRTNMTNKTTRESKTRRTCRKSETNMTSRTSRTSRTSQAGRTIRKNRKSRTPLLYFPKKLQNIARSQNAGLSTFHQLLRFQIVITNKLFKIFVIKIFCHTNFWS